MLGQEPKRGTIDQISERSTPAGPEESVGKDEEVRGAGGRRPFYRKKGQIPSSQMASG